MKPGKLPESLKLYQQATNRMTFWIKDSNSVAIDLTGAVITCFLKASGTSHNQTNIVIVNAEGKVTITFNLTGITSHKGTWGVKVTWSNGDIWRLLEGTVDYVSEL